MTEEKNHKKLQKNLLFAVVVLFWFALYVYIPYQTPYLSGLSVSAGFIGTIVGAYGITQLLLRLPVGVAADCAGGHKRFVILGALLAGSASIVRICIPSGTGFLIGNLISGCASSVSLS